MAIEREARQSYQLQEQSNNEIAQSTDLSPKIVGWKTPDSPLLRTSNVVVSGASLRRVDRPPAARGRPHFPF
jgi:hypothetical protein